MLIGFPKKKYVILDLIFQRWSRNKNRQTKKGVITKLNGERKTWTWGEKRNTANSLSIHQVGEEIMNNF